MSKHYRICTLFIRWTLLELVSLELNYTSSSIFIWQAFDHYATTLTSFEFLLQNVISSKYAHINFSSKKHKTNSSTDLPRALEKFSVIKITWNGCIPFVEFLFEKISVKIHNISRVSLTNYKLLFQGCVHSLSRKKTSNAIAVEL